MHHIPGAAKELMRGGLRMRRLPMPLPISCNDFALLDQMGYKVVIKNGLMKRVVRKRQHFVATIFRRLGRRELQMPEIGKQYTNVSTAFFVLDVFENTAMLQRQTDNEIIIAHRVEVTGTNIEWGHGIYYGRNLKAAVNAFNYLHGAVVCNA